MYEPNTEVNRSLKSTEIYENMQFKRSFRWLFHHLYQNLPSKENQKHNLTHDTLIIEHIF